MKGLLFTYLLTYGGAFTALFRPYYGFLIYVCFSIIKPPALWFWMVPPGNYSRIIGVALLIGWVFNGCGNWNFGRSRTTLLCLIGFLAWMILSTALSPSPVMGWHEVLNYTKIVLPFLAGLTLINSREDIRKLVWVIIASTGYVAYEYNVHYFSGGDHDHFLKLDGNSLSIMMLSGCGVAFYYGLFLQHGWRRWLLFLISALIAHIPMASMSRGGMVGVVALGGVSFVLIPKTIRFLTFYGLACMAGLYLAGPSVVTEFISTFTDKNEWENDHYGRVFMWKACFNEMTKHPLIGCGQDRWPLVAKSYGFGEGKEAHSLWAQTAAELGVPGIGFLGGFYLYTIWSLWRLSREQSDPELRALSKMVILGLTGFVVPASFVSVQGFEIPYYVALIGAAVLKLSDSTVGVFPPYAVAEHAMRSQHHDGSRYRTTSAPNAPVESFGFPWTVLNETRAYWGRQGP